MDRISKDVFVSSFIVPIVRYTESLFLRIVSVIICTSIEHLIELSVYTLGSSYHTRIARDFLSVPNVPESKGTVVQNQLLKIHTHFEFINDQSDCPSCAI